MLSQPLSVKFCSLLDVAVRRGHVLVRAILDAKAGVMGNSVGRTHCADPLCVSALTAVLERDYFLSDEFLALASKAHVPVLKLYLVVRESTVSHAVSGWDVSRIEAAVIEFSRTCLDGFGATTRRAPAPDDSLLRPKLRETWRMYLVAVEALGPGIGDDEAYEWVRENRPETYKMPTRSAWLKRLGTARRVMGVWKKRPCARSN